MCFAFDVRFVGCLELWRRRATCDRRAWVIYVSVFFCFVIDSENSVQEVHVIILCAA